MEETVCLSFFFFSPPSLKKIEHEHDFRGNTHALNRGTLTSKLTNIIPRLNKVANPKVVSYQGNKRMRGIES